MTQGPAGAATFPARFRPVAAADPCRLGLSACPYHRVLRVARTVADVADSETLTADHVSEALQYRGFDPGC